MLSVINLNPHNTDLYEDKNDLRATITAVLSKLVKTQKIIINENDCDKS